jgi:hypothetical protein
MLARNSLQETQSSRAREFDGPVRRFGIYGISYRLNSFIRLILNGETSDHEDKTKSYSKAMATVELDW